jgi:ankyrin repeat protein
MNYLISRKIKQQKEIYHYAAKISNIETLKKATEKDLNKRDDDGRTPTHWAAFKGNINALILIISKGYICCF